jgi:TPP-dependent pyruvate/acetoin dehydrogenase alpha subunit
MSFDAGVENTRGVSEVDTAHELDLYRRMLVIRRFEERVYLLYLQGQIPGTLHQSQGQEAVAVGVCDALRRTDWITSTHRPHGHALAKGVELRAAMAELFGKATGCCGGKGGSMHLGDPSVGMLPAIAIVGGGNTVVTGLGLAFKLMRTDQVAVCFFGDGASNEGAFHEGLNFAAVQHLPIVFACENNLYGASTPFHETSLVPDVATGAAAYGVRGEIVDGMDVLAVRETAGRAVAEARSGAGPVLLEFKTYRFAGHSRGDVRGYRSRDEEADWKERDPIVRLRARLALTLSEPVIDETDAHVEAALDDAIEFARHSPLPRAEDALTGTYATVIGSEATP